MEFSRINHIALDAPPKQEERARWFYGEVLGLKEIATPKSLDNLYEMVWFEISDFLLHIVFTAFYVKPEWAIENGVIMPGCHFAMEVKNIKSMRARLESHKVDIRDAAHIPGRERFYIVDPFGNFIEIIEFLKT